MQSIHQSTPRLGLPPILEARLPRQVCDAVCRCGAPCIEEIRLHANRVATVTSRNQSYPTPIKLSAEQMHAILVTLCGGSLYAYRESICQGYLALGGGVRVGVCGSAALENGSIIGVNDVSGLIIRVPHHIPVDATPLLERLMKRGGTQGLLIYAPPGVGKTTLLRAVAREASSPRRGLRTVAVDTREELVYGLDSPDLLLDVLLGYPREVGISIAVRTLGAQLIVCDEIGGDADADAILSAASCGVPLVASAHADSLSALLARPFLQRLHRAAVFGCYVGLRRDGGQISYQFTDRENL